MRVEDFDWRDGSSEVRWTWAGHRLSSDYETPVPKALPLHDGSGIAIVEPHEDVGPNNFVVVNADASARFRVLLPVEGRFWFVDAYYVRGELTVIEARVGVDFAHVVDEASGRIERTYETR